MNIKKEQDINDPDVTLGMTDSEMTKRSQRAVELANLKAKVLGLPIQKYDAEWHQLYLVYPDGSREYV